MVACDGLHDVYDHIPQVHQHPLAGVRPFHAQHGGADLSNLVVHAFCECTGLAVAGATGEHHAVEEGGDGGGVENLDVLGFYVLQGIYHKELQAGEISVQGGAPNRWMLNRVGLASRTVVSPVSQTLRLVVNITVPGQRSASTTPTPATTAALAKAWSRVAMGTPRRNARSRYTAS
ncbi:MAG: hypothetical protein RJA58_1351 [Pseudomonadota bacterium]